MVIIPKTPPKEDKWWWQEVERNIRLGIGREKVLAQQEMAAIKKAQEAMDFKTVDGLGQLSMVIPLNTYLRWHQQEEGCWNDKAFKREFYRDNPEVRAKRPVKKYY